MDEKMEQLNKTIKSAAKECDMDFIFASVANDGSGNSYAGYEVEDEDALILLIAQIIFAFCWKNNFDTKEFVEALTDGVEGYVEYASRIKIVD